jgi:hypothetical protein
MKTIRHSRGAAVGTACNTPFQSLNTCSSNNLYWFPRAETTYVHNKRCLMTEYFVNVTCGIVTGHSVSVTQVMSARILPLNCLSQDRLSWKVLCSNLDRRTGSHYRFSQLLHTVRVGHDSSITFLRCAVTLSAWSNGRSHDPVRTYAACIIQTVAVKWN